MEKHNRNGMKDFSWSGIGALFTDEDFNLEFNSRMIANFDNIDGPYVIGEEIYTVNENNILTKSNTDRTDTLKVVVNNQSKDLFQLNLQDSLTSSKAIYPKSEKLIAISDIEGNFNAFSSFLKANKVIDGNYNWTFGNGNLVLNGDFVDRGNDVTQVLWLIYKLDYQSREYDGKVHFILGNHEIINFQGNWNYNKRKYIKIAQEISGNEDWDKSLQFLYSNKTELGNWLRTKNVIEKIGDYIFVHAGLHPEILEFEIDINQINEITRENWDKDLYNNPKENLKANFLIGRKSPIWYRGLVTEYKYYEKIKEAELDKILEYYNAKKIVVGHTVVKDISTDFNGKVIRIDLKHGTEKNSGMTKGLLIENGIEYRIDDKGNKYVL
jgi:hypothetical protein